MRYTAHIVDPSVGYTQAALHYMMALRTAEVPFKFHPISGGVLWPTMPSWCRPISKINAVDPGQEPNLIHHTPDVCVYENLRFSRSNIALTVTETHRIPMWLAAKLSELDAVIVPSQFNKVAFEQSGVSVPIYVVPHTMGPYWWQKEARRWKDGEPFTFYYIGAFNTRKNPACALRAYLRAFPKASRDVRFMLKVTTSAGMTDYIKSLLAEEVGSAARLEQDIVLYNQSMSDDQIRWMHEMGDCFVSTHRGEGWGYGLMQAALLGRPVIYTDWSAPTEYLSALHGHYPVEYTMTSVGDGGGNVPYFLGGYLEWAEPDITSVVDAMQAAYRERTGTPVSAFTARRLREGYAWATVGKQLGEVVDLYR